MIPYAKYPGLSALFLEFLSGLPDFYPDPPSLEAAAERGRAMLASGARPRFSAAAFRYRSPEGAALAGALVSGRAVAVQTGHQIGLFTGPLFTLVKALHATHVARELSRRGVPAVPVFWALTDDHDLQEIAWTARPGPHGPDVLVLEGADRQNRQPVGRLRIPEGVTRIVEAFRPDADSPAAAAILDAFARRSHPGAPYSEAFVETLFDLVEPEPLLVLTPLSEELRAGTVAFFREAARREAEIRRTLSATEEKLRRTGRPVSAPVRADVFPFFAIDGDGRRRVEDVPAALSRFDAGEAWPSADVLTRPVMKSFLFPIAASVLGAAEIAYHAQLLPLYPLFGLAPPVLLPRVHVVLRGPTERRLIEALGLAGEDLLAAAAAAPATPVPEAEELASLARRADEELSSVAPRLERLDPTLLGALENARKKITHQFEQLAERARRATERRTQVGSSRRARLEQIFLPDGQPAERLYPPLVPMLAWGDEVRDALRRAVADADFRGAAIVDLGLAPARR